MKLPLLTSDSSNASVMQMKAFNVRLADDDLKRLSDKAKKRGVSKTELLRDWIRGDDERTVANARIWEERNAGNQSLRIRCD